MPCSPGCPVSTASRQTRPCYLSASRVIQCTTCFCPPAPSWTRLKPSPPPASGTTRFADPRCSAVSKHPETGFLGRKTGRGLPPSDAKDCDFWFEPRRAFSALRRRRGVSWGARPRLELGRAVGPQRGRNVIPTSEIGWPTWIRTMKTAFQGLFAGSSSCNLCVAHCSQRMQYGPLFAISLLHLAAFGHAIFCVGTCQNHVVCRNCVGGKRGQRLCPRCVPGTGRVFGQMTTPQTVTG